MTAPELLEALALAARQSIALATVNFLALDPSIQGMAHAGNLGGYRFNRRSQQGVLATLLLHHAHGALTHFR